MATIKSIYLLTYNATSLALWAYLTWQALILTPSLLAQDRLQDLYPAMLKPLLTGIQSLAFLEILHAATGLVRASTLTTAIQVTGKNLVVWTVMVRFPDVIVGSGGEGAAGKWGFLGCVVFWGVSEVVRYGYFVVLLVTGDVPGPLKWLRYVFVIFLFTTMFPFW